MSRELVTKKGAPALKESRGSHFEKKTRMLTRALGCLFPEAWQRFRAGGPEPDRDDDLAAGYARLLASPDPAIRDQAARNWCAWETAIAPTAGSHDNSAGITSALVDATNRFAAPSQTAALLVPSVSGRPAARRS